MTEPLTPDDEQALRARLDAIDAMLPDDDYSLQWSNYTCRRLLATLDAERARTVVLAEWVQGMRAVVARTDDGNATRWKMLGFIDDLLARLAVLPVDRKPDREPCPNGPCVACSGTGWVGPNFRANRGLPPYKPVLPVDRVGVEPLDVETWRREVA